MKTKTGKTEKTPVIYMKTETPIRRQYLEIKAKYKDALLLFRLGDF